MDELKRIEEIKELLFNEIDRSLSDHNTLEYYVIDVDDLEFLIDLAEKHIQFRRSV